MLIASFILLCSNIILMIVFYRKTAHNFSQNAYRDRIREEVNRLIIDIEHESDHAVTVLEDKIRQIEKLISDTDKHIALVEQEHEKWRTQQAFLDQYQAVKKQEAEPVSDGAKNPVMIYKKPLGAPSVAEIKPTSFLNPREQVIELARQGFSIDFIAEKVDLPLGEIALILSIEV
jgi:hypothetical protein